MSLLLTLNWFHILLIVDFERVNASWVSVCQKYITASWNLIEFQQTLLPAIWLVSHKQEKNKVTGNSNNGKSVQFSVFSDTYNFHFHHIVRYTDSPVLGNRSRYQVSLSHYRSLKLNRCNLRREMLSTSQLEPGFLPHLRKDFATIGFPFLSGISVTELSRITEQQGKWNSPD